MIMKFIFIFGIIIIVHSLVYSCSWTIDETIVFFLKKEYLNGIISLILAILLSTVHLILFDKVVQYYVGAFL